VDLKLAKSIETVTYDEYRRGKTSRHAGNYDGGARTLATLAMISMDEAKVLLAKFHEKYWKIRAYFHKDVREHVQSTLWLNTPYGRRRDFFVNPSSSQWIREAYGYIPQSTVSDKTKIAMYKGSEKLKEQKIDFHMLSESHDSLLSEVKIGQEPEYNKIMKDLFEEPIDMRKCCVPRDIDAIIQFESTVGMNWKEMKEVKV
jgi:DNA polymerase I-like protein with 3'-5' exonuclease and polymerase domains